MKKILVINYSQSGQLDEILANFISGLSADIDRINFHPKTKYPFPWDKKKFFEQMPDSVLEIPVELNEIKFKYEAYDLIIFGYQPWYLSPSIPATSVFHDTEFLKRLKNTPVITVIGARNLWLSAQESVKRNIKNAGGILVGNLPFVDKSNNALGVVSILHWMLKGKKERPYGVFPKPGVDEKDIKDAAKYTPILQKALKENNFTKLQEQFRSLKLFNVEAAFAFAEPKAKKVFTLWAKVIKRKTNKKLWTKLFVYYLLFVIFVVVPIEITLYYLLIYPFTIKQIKEKKDYFCSTNFEE